ncbi:MAG: SUF system NifU family Fe-S cluster assembly protein [Verrucomicrobia bacterium]|nr:SUF system NifU family Fe-S cluster assembly protein [Verrucomicrobiota bacterium]
MSDDLDDLYQQVILDHNRSPRNFQKLEGANHVAQGYNPLCGDHLKVYLILDGDVIRDITFDGTGCAISRASASMMTSALKGKTVAEVKQLFKKIHDMVTTGNVREDEIGKLAVFAGVHKFPARVKCAILAWHAALAALDGRAEPVSTE